VLVASPGYFKRYGKPTSLPELEQHREIIYTNRGASDWRFRVGRKFVSVNPTVALRVNAMPQLPGLVLRYWRRSFLKNR
jgi:hypothetical protein